MHRSHCLPSGQNEPENEVGQITKDFCLAQVAEEESRFWNKIQPLFLSFSYLFHNTFCNYAAVSCYSLQLVSIYINVDSYSVKVGEVKTDNVLRSLSSAYLSWLTSDLAKPYCSCLTEVIVVLGINAN